MKLRKSLVKPVTRQKTRNYNELFDSSARYRHAGRIQCHSLNVRRYICVVHDDLVWKPNNIIAGFLPRHWLYE